MSESRANSKPVPGSADAVARQIIMRAQEAARASVRDEVKSSIGDMIARLPDTVVKNEMDAKALGAAIGKEFMRLVEPLAEAATRTIKVEPKFENIIPKAPEPKVIFKETVIPAPESTVTVDTAPIAEAMKAGFEALIKAMEKRPIVVEKVEIQRDPRPMEFKFTFNAQGRISGGTMKPV